MDRTDSNQNSSIVERYSSGAPLEESVGYSRTVRIGPTVYVGGTTAVQTDGSVYGEQDAYAQTAYVLDRMIGFLADAGAKAEEVVRVKIFLTDVSKARECLLAYTERFGRTKPICTMVGIASLNRPAQLVEIEIEAYSPG
ncbi:MAG: Rid family hydrolase [Alkalispirochaetaceae bacterium]